jgi:hypothetical protein
MIRVINGIEVTDTSVRWPIEGGEFLLVLVDGETVHFERLVPVDDGELLGCGLVSVSHWQTEFVEALLDLIDAPPQARELKVTRPLSNGIPERPF